MGVPEIASGTKIHAERLSMKFLLKEWGVCHSQKYLKILVLPLGLWICISLQGLTQTLAGIPSETNFASAQHDLNEARHLVVAGEFKEAEARLRAYLSQNETSVDGRFLLGYVLLRLNKPRESLAEYTHAAQFRRPSAEDLKNVALAYVLLEDYDDAQKWMRRSIEMNDKDPDAWYGLGRILYTKQ